jgi:hypothetical protein
MKYEILDSALLTDSDAINLLHMYKYMCVK